MPGGTRPHRRPGTGDGPSASPASSLFWETVLDLFTVTGAASSVEEGIEALRAAPAENLRTELEAAAELQFRRIILDDRRGNG
ncbi:hypothetical protein ACFXAF_13320 [Kitasatospora sp. NPDC059463]|uniref:hypothetical protein n=1 Tax=unclassified Kitasatospora TaxID=2633591 RepID=UPI00368474BA